MRKLISLLLVCLATAGSLQAQTDTILVRPQDLDSTIINGRKYYTLKIPITTVVNVSIDSVRTVYVDSTGSVKPPTTRSTAALTEKLVASDNGNFVEFTATSQNNLQCKIPKDLPDGFQCTIIQGNTAAVLVTGETGVTVKARKNQQRTATQNSVIRISATGKNRYHVYWDSKL